MPLRAAIIAGFLSAQAAVAGPWPDATTGTFLTVTEDLSDAGQRGTTALSIENGGSERFTIGIDTEVSDTSDDWSAYAFIRQPLSDRGASDQVAVSAGLGARQTADGTEPVVVLGGIWGRNVENGVGGWLSLEGEARYGTSTGETAFIGGATVAIEPVDRIALVNQLSVSGIAGSPDDSETQLTSSIVGAVSERARVQLGATVDLSGNSSPGLRLGTWLEF